MVKDKVDYGNGMWYSVWLVMIVNEKVDYGKGMWYQFEEKLSTGDPTVGGSEKRE